MNYVHLFFAYQLELTVKLMI